MSPDLVTAVGAGAVIVFTGGGVLRSRRRSEPRSNATDVEQLPKSWRVLPSDEDVRTAVERALQYEQERARSAGERAIKYERYLDELETTGLVGEQQASTVRVLASGAHSSSSPPAAA